ncbi:MAG: hypothetical protein OM95_06900 [Bdellovibrio sp. ArHS]|uniref:hypothetical protein n=1 Tax=Bdellovibrio sp. ArHS TaxID=1569284 RepID=UPI0005836B18|nr:hypothetical protein [Bdellovibrio sp. ArHS]KHD88838.1 MAG: hypothetical protein OM95_06900 [Bdellovibrio sp. ArHS]
MAKVIHKSFKKTLTVSSDQVIGQIDVTNCNGISVQINGITGTAGSMKLQRSNDNTNWEDIPSATVTLAANSAKTINVPDLYSGHVQILVTLSAGAGEYNFYCLAKEY